MELDFTSDTVEKLLFKRALADKNWLNIIANVYDPRWFKTKHLGILIKLAIKYYEKYSVAPTTPLMSALAKKYSANHPTEDFNLAEVNSLITEIGNLSLNIPEDVLQSNLKEFIRKNALSSSLMDNIDLIAMSESEKDSEKYQQIVEKCLENFDRVQKITFNDNDLGMNYFDQAAMEKHWDFIRNPDMKVKTGWEAIDHYTNGGFLKDGRMLAIFMAQAGLGKSVFLSNLAVNFLKQNLSVVVISLEMSQDVYAQRFDAHISKKNINRLRENEQTAVDRIKSFYAQHPESGLFIKEYPPRSVNSRTIEQYLDNLKAAGHKIDIVIIDYLNLVLPNKSQDSMFKDGMTVSEELRALSYKYAVPFFSAVQANSEGMNTQEIDMQNVSESRGICHTVDFLGALYQTPEQRENGIIGFKIVKNRFGLVGKTAKFKIDYETLCVADTTFSGDIDDSGPGQSELGKIVNSLPDITNDISEI